MERCDDEKVVFNARVEESEMIISLHEYQKMQDCIDEKEQINKEAKSYIQHLEEQNKKYQEEKQRILTEVEMVNKENRKLKQGIINFVKGLGG